MKRLIAKNILIIVLFSIISMCAPFLKFSNETKEEAINAEGSHTVVYNELSGLELIIKSVPALYSSTISKTDRIIFYIIISLGIIIIIQFTVTLFNKHKPVLYTAVLIFAALFSLLVFIVRNDRIEIIRYGYYCFLFIQAVIILFAGLAPTQQAKKEI